MTLGNIAPTYEVACRAPKRPQEGVSLKCRFEPSVACVLRDSGVVEDGWRFWFTPRHAPGYEPTLFTAGEEALELIYSKIPPVDVLLSHGPSRGACDRASGSIVKDARVGRTGFRDLEDEVENSGFKKKLPTPPCLGSEALARRLEELSVKLHACGHVHARQSTHAPDVRHCVVGGTLHVNAAMMKTMPSAHYQFGPENEQKALRSPVVANPSENGGACAPGP